MKPIKNQLLSAINYISDPPPHPQPNIIIMQGEHWDVTHSAGKEQQQAGGDPAPGMQQQPFMGFGGIDQNWGGFGQMMPRG